MLDHRVDLVGHEDHRGAAVHRLAADELGDCLLVVQVEGVQGFVAEQNLGVGGQRLSGAQSLLFSSGEQSHRHVSVGRGADGMEQLIHTAAQPPGVQSHAESMAVQTQGHHVTGSKRRLLGHGLLLRDVADAAAAPPHGLSADLHRPGAEPGQTEQHLEEGGLARAVGSQHRKELTGHQLQVQAFPEHAPVEAHTGLAQLHDRLRTAGCGRWRRGNCGGGPCGGGAGISHGHPPPPSPRRRCCSPSTPRRSRAPAGSSR